MNQVWWIRIFICYRNLFVVRSNAMKKQRFFRIVWNLMTSMRMKGFSVLCQLFIRDFSGIVNDFEKIIRKWFHFVWNFNNLVFGVEQMIPEVLIYQVWVRPALFRQKNLFLSVRFDEFLKKYAALLYQLKETK